MDAAPVTFDLAGRMAAKADPALIGNDERHLAAVAASLARTVRDLTDRLARTRTLPAGAGERALDRDREIHRLSARLRTLQRFGADLCLGRMVRDDGSDPVYVGRLGLTDADGRRLLVDWRSPVAEPFFGATHAHPMGLASRRRYRWDHGVITDYWDEVFTAGGLAASAALDDHSAFVAGLGSARGERMRDVLGTIAADQDAAIRAGSAGTLVVDGGPGTGKTVVALHRSAYLLYSDPRLDRRRGGVLFVGPHEPYLDYVADVLPGLGEDGVRTCTLRQFVVEGATAGDEADPRVARLKASARLLDAVEAAVAFHEQPPTAPLTVETDGGDLTLHPEDWADAFAAPDPGTPHHEARDTVWEQLLAILVDRSDGEVPERELRRSLALHPGLVGAFGRAWPRLEAADVVGDLWSVPAYLRHCAPWLTPDEARALRRAEGAPWTVSDLPLLDAARRRLGDPDASRARTRREAALAADRERMDRVVDELVAADDSELLLMTMLRGQDARNDLVDEARLDPSAPAGTPAALATALAGPFAHVVVDEAQELTDAQWRMLLDRCPSRSFTVVGDRAQARAGFAGTWRERLERAGLDRVEVATLRVNYRTPREVMAAAEPVIRAVLPDANVPLSVRAGGVPVRHGRVAELDRVLDDWLASRADGVACVIGADVRPPRPRPRARWLTPELVKGLEFDLVVLVEPETWGADDGPDPDADAARIAAPVDRYVAMTRATSQLVVLSG